MDIVIIGSGIIGVSTAYYLSRLNKTPGSQIHLIECTPQLFASASAYAGGFLAKDWFSPAVASLGTLSFDLHRHLAEENNGRREWGYCPSTALSMSIEEHAKKSGRRGEDWLFQGTSRAEVAKSHPGLETMNAAPLWMTKVKGGSVDIISSGTTTAQLDPFKLCQFLMDACVSKGVQIHQPAKPVSIRMNVAGRLDGINIRSLHNDRMKTLPCASILLAAGAWTPSIFQDLFPESKLRIPITSLAGHHIVLRSPRFPNPPTDELTEKVDSEAAKSDCHAVFSSIPSSIGSFSPEFFSRTNGEIWFGGLNSSTIPLPNLATAAKVDEYSVTLLKDVARKLLGSPDEAGNDDLEVLREAVCFRPVTASGKPIVARIRDSKLGGVRSQINRGGVFVAAGHGPWGIALSLGTGKVMAEMIEREEMSADVTGLDI